MGDRGYGLEEQVLQGRCPPFSNILTKEECLAPKKTVSVVIPTPDHVGERPPYKGTSYIKLSPTHLKSSNAP